MIEYKDEINNFYDLQNLCWSGAISRLNEIQDLGLEQEFMSYLTSIFCDTIPTLTKINDFIWFECDDWIAEHTPNDEDDE